MNGLRDLRDTLKQLKHSRPQPKFCPVCNGRNIYPYSVFGILPTIYVCRDCGYNGVLTLEIEEEKNNDERRSDPEDGKAPLNVK